MCVQNRRCSEAARAINPQVPRNKLNDRVAYGMLHTSTRILVFGSLFVIAFMLNRNRQLLRIFNGTFSVTYIMGAFSHFLATVTAIVTNMTFPSVPDFNS